MSSILPAPEASLPGGHVQKLVEPGHLLFDDLDDAVLDGFGGGAG